MHRFGGKGVCGAIGIGTVSIFKRQDRKTCRVQTENTEKEIKRVEAAALRAGALLSEVYEKALREAGEEAAEIFRAHQTLLEDEGYREVIRDIIRKQSVNAEYAVIEATRFFADKFEMMEDTYMRERVADVKEVSKCLITCLTDEDMSAMCVTGADTSRIRREGTGENASNISCGSVLCAEDLAPGEMVMLDKDRVTAIVTAFGSTQSHMAILARNMNIPTVVGVGEDFLHAVKDGDRIIVDGHAGEIILNPEEDVVVSARQRQECDLQNKKLLEEQKGLETVTVDGTRVEIGANIGSADDVDDALANGAEGIGLFRTEFLYLKCRELPSEEQQYNIYRRVLERMSGRRVIIRTIDVGADKQIDYLGMDREENPALGIRGIRLSLTRPEIFRTQLRALYRASVHGKLGIMFPMITSVAEVQKIKTACQQVKEELSAEKIPYDESVEFGIMIETPAAAVISDRLAPLVDFFSVGTNDLTQYTLACDRQNKSVEPFCDTRHEAILRLIEMAAKNAHAHGAWIGICGELAADHTLTEQFLRMGIDELSVPASEVLSMRENIRKLNLANSGRTVP